MNTSLNFIIGGAESQGYLLGPSDICELRFSY